MAQSTNPTSSADGIDVSKPIAILKSTLVGHTAKVTTLNFSCNGKLLASADAENTIKVWDIDSSKLCKQFIGHRLPIMDMCWSGDDKLLVSASMDKTLRIWGILSGKSLKVLEGHTDSVFRCAFNPSSYLIISASTKGDIHVWDVKTCSLIKKFKNNPYNDEINILRFNESGTRIICTSAAGYWHIWDIAEEQCLERKFGEPILKIELLRRSNYVVVATIRSFVGYWKMCNPFKQRRMATCTLNNEYVTTWIGPKETWVISKCLSEQGLYVWNLNKSRIVQELKCHNEKISFVACHSDTGMIATVAFGNDQTIKVWTVAEQLY